MKYKIDANESGLFVATEGTILHPIGQTNFQLGDLIRVEYATNQMVTLIDDSIETTNPYTETWHATYIDTHVGLEMKKHQDIDTSEMNNFRYDHNPIDLIIWMLVIVTTCWMLVIDFKLLFWR